MVKDHVAGVPPESVLNMDSNLLLISWEAYLGGPAQNTPNFQMAPTPKKTYQNCWMYSPDGGPKVS
jgi:hypothetical protein